ncbi:MAG TPA: trehalase family glycosidase [Anaerolineales bacterium]|nr:trehalase family glycosidase [Anaerolineales bacterium]
MQQFPDLHHWLQKAKALLESNRIEIDGHSYTAPTLDLDDFGRRDYANQFLWDSCFHAIIWRLIDHQKAQAELLSLLSHQVKDGPDAGMIPHCIYWHNGGGWLWSQSDRSSLTQPPLIAFAAFMVFEYSKALEFLAAIYSQVEKYHDWFDRRRDPDHDGLVCIIHPWEAGGDAPPRWDKLLDFDSYDPEVGRATRIKMVEKLIRYSYDPIALAQHHGFHVESLEINGIRAADLEAMADIAMILDKPEEAAAWLRRVDAVRSGFRSRMIVDGLPYDLDGMEEKPIPQANAGQFVTLFGGLPTYEQAQQLVQQLKQTNFWTAFPVTNTPTDSLEYEPDHYWRGNVWPCLNWLIYQGLRRYGFQDVADELAIRSFALLEQSGFWEYYHPQTGKGLGGQAFSWAAVMLDMIISAAPRLEKKA